MSREDTLFNLGIVLKWAEQGLTKASIALETRVDKLTGKKLKKDTAIMVTRPDKKLRKRELKELAKSQDRKLERLETLENSKEQMGQEADIYKD